MKMRKLDSKALYDIREGLVIRVKYPDGQTKTGVIYSLRRRGLGKNRIKCNVKKGTPFFITKQEIKSGKIEFAILWNHSPIDTFGLNCKWDFVSNH